MDRFLNGQLLHFPQSHLFLHDFPEVAFYICLEKKGSHLSQLKLLPVYLLPLICKGERGRSKSRFYSQPTPQPFKKAETAAYLHSLLPNVSGSRNKKGGIFDGNGRVEVFLFLCKVWKAKWLLTHFRHVESHRVSASKTRVSTKQDENQVPIPCFRAFFWSTAVVLPPVVCKEYDALSKGAFSHAV